MPEKVGALTPLGVEKGKYNGTSKKGGLKVVIFVATFTILLMEDSPYDTDHAVNSNLQLTIFHKKRITSSTSSALKKFAHVIH